MIYGIGINDATYKTHNGKQIVCPFYNAWKGMLDRNKRIGTPIANEWLTFSTFKIWMETQAWEGNELDKDLFGGVGYSPANCCFIPRHVNSFMQDKRKTDSTLPLGVSMNRNGDRYKAYAASDYLGTFDTAELAHEAWRTFKFNRAQILAEVLRSSGYSDRICQHLTDKYKEK